MKPYPSFLRPMYHFLAFNLLHRYRLNRRVTTSVNGIRLVIEPSVMHPRVFKSGRVFAEYLANRDFRGKTILDVGTGSGILAITAARLGAKVTATDVNPNAVVCAQQNVRYNGCTSSVTVIESDLFDSISSTGFDIIIFNPPYLMLAPESSYKTAMQGGADLVLMKRFAADASNYLRNGAFLLMILSTDAPLDLIFSIFSDSGYSRDVLRQRSGLFEEFLICQFTPQLPSYDGTGTL